MAATPVNNKPATAAAAIGIRTIVDLAIVKSPRLNEREVKWFWPIADISSAV